MKLFTYNQNFNSLHSKQGNMAYIRTSLRCIPNSGVTDFL